MPQSYSESKSETYVSLDIETNGPAPGLNSMLALGAAAFVDGKQVDTFYVKLHYEPGTFWDPDTARWWEKQSPEARAELHTDRQPPGRAIPDFVTWVEALPGDRKVAVAWPAAYDFAFVNWYCHRYTGRNPLGYACVDIRSYADGLAWNPRYYGLGEDEIRELVGAIDTTGLRPHVAVDDAIGQGRLF